MERFGRRKRQAQAHPSLCLGLARHCIHYLGMRVSIRKENFYLSTSKHSCIFPFPQKTTPLPGTLELPTVLNWSRSEESVGSTVRFFQGRIGLSESPDLGKSHLTIEREVFSNPEGFSACTHIATHTHTHTHTHTRAHARTRTHAHARTRIRARAS